MVATIHINATMRAQAGERDELVRQMVERCPEVHVLGGTSVVTVDSRDDTIRHFNEMFPDDAAMAADMRTQLVRSLLADLLESTAHGTDFRLETTYRRALNPS